MRLVRLAALFGSLVLLTATLVLVIERRGDVRDDQSARVRGAADAALVSMNGVLSGAATAVEQRIETLSAAPATAELEAAASSLATVTPDASACVGSSSSAVCSADDLLALDLAGTLLATSDAVDGAVVMGVDETTESVLVLRRAFTPDATDGDDPAIAIVSIPVEELITTFARSLADQQGAEYALRLVDGVSGNGRDEPGVVDGLLLVRDRVAEPFAVGAVDVVTAVDGDIGLFGDSPNFFVLLIGLGSILLVLAAATFLADRRNLEEQAATDDLTGLANRREFERLAAEAVELADRFGTGLTVMMVDLNGFKQINDTLGHQYGDLVLKGVADRLVRAVRDTDVVGRWGGDEFVILLPGLDESTAIRSSAERITTTLSSSPVVGDTVMRASIGAAAFPRHGGSFSTLMRTADAAMYSAKSGGVDHRVADAELARRANGVEDHAEPTDEDLVVTSDYVGPDRRSLGAPLPDSPIVDRARDDSPSRDERFDEAADDADDDDDVSPDEVAADPVAMVEVDEQRDEDAVERSIGSADLDSLEEVAHVECDPVDEVAVDADAAVTTAAGVPGAVIEPPQVAGLIDGPPSMLEELAAAAFPPVELERSATEIADDTPVVRSDDTSATT